MVPTWFLLASSGVAVLGAALWFRAATFRIRFLRRIDRTSTDPEVRLLASGALSRDLHATVLYVGVAGVLLAAAISKSSDSWYLFAFLLLPVGSTVVLSRYARRDARLAERRLHLEQRAHETLMQADLAPRMWAARLAPPVLPDTPGYEIGTAHQAGAGVMSGDLLDVFYLPSGRLCCVVGDVSGHDVEASITALQTKFLLRSYLRRYRDPGQALEELNRQLVDYERPEEFVSLCVMIFDDDAGTVRYASAGHPPAWLCEQRNVRPLRATGPVLMLDRESTYLSREEQVSSGDVLLMLTDGLTEARDGHEFFGEERIAGILRRHHDDAPQVLCKSLLDGAAEFAANALADDVTIMAIRRR